MSPEQIERETEGNRGEKAQGNVRGHNRGDKGQE